jgi:lipoprotein-anchoring transpeptidase ErfK/SrfK
VLEVLEGLHLEHLSIPVIPAMSRFLFALLAAVLLASGATAAYAQEYSVDLGILDLLPPSPPWLESTSHLVTRKDSVASANARRAAERSSAMRIVVSIGARRLWVLSETDTLLAAPVAVGMGRTLAYAGKRWTFATPLGVRNVRAKRSTPHWRPPDWAYAEVAREHGLKLVRMREGRPMLLGDGRRLVVRDSLVGVMMPDGFAPLPVEEHIVFGETLYVPPHGTRNRLIEGTLGLYQLDLGDGYLLHGTPNEESIGWATTHGCVRLRGNDIEWLFANVPVGTAVYLY